MGEPQRPDGHTELLGAVLGVLHVPAVEETGKAARRLQDHPEPDQCQRAGENLPDHSRAGAHRCPRSDLGPDQDSRLQESHEPDIDVSQRQERDGSDECGDAEDEVRGRRRDVNRQAEDDDEKRDMDDATADAEDAREDADDGDEQESAAGPDQRAERADRHSEADQDDEVERCHGVPSLVSRVDYG